MKAKKQRRKPRRIVLSVLKASPSGLAPVANHSIPRHRPSLYQDANQSVGMGGLPFESSTSCIRTVRGADQFLAPNQLCLALHLCEYRRGPGHNLKLANLKGARLALAELRLA